MCLSNHLCFGEGQLSSWERLSILYHSLPAPLQPHGLKVNPTFRCWDSLSGDLGVEALVEACGG